MNHAQGLCTGRQTLDFGQAIQSIQDSLYLVLPPQFLQEFLCDTLRMAEVYATMHSLNRPCLICFVARASTESNSAIIFTMTSVIMGVGGILI